MAEPTTLRLFFALQPAPELASAISEAAAPLAAQVRGQLVPPSNVHATLCFLGAVTPGRLEALKAAAASIRGAAGELRFDAIDLWDKPRILCGVASRVPVEAAALAKAVRVAVVGAGFTPDDKPFRPHLTVARKISRAQASSLTWPRDISPGFVVRYERFVLMESRRGERGSIYSVVDSWPLYGRKEG